MTQPIAAAIRAALLSGEQRSWSRAGSRGHDARILERILDDEIRHVAIGTKHFHETSLARGELPRELWRNLVKTRFRGPLKPPFNDSARRAAGLSRSWYASVA